MRGYRALFFAAMGAAICGAAAFSQQTGNVRIVDDDGVQRPGALTTIQETVSKAGQGRTILVCPGTSHKMARIAGLEKTGLKLIALGNDDDVVLEGDHTEAHGILLEDVTNVLVRGFTIREWGDKRTTATDCGWGCGINLLRAHYNTIEHNRISKTDMDGITVDHSGHNVIRYNFITQIDAGGCGIGIRLWGGRGTTENFVYTNRAALSPLIGIAVCGAGPGNAIVDNNLNDNGLGGIAHWGTQGTLIEGNRLSHNSGFWGVAPIEGDYRSSRIEIGNSDEVTVVGKMVHNNTRVDILWDKKGTIVLENNACGSARQAGLCSRQAN
jgi:parallel beta-helix repeat protein